MRLRPAAATLAASAVLLVACGDGEPVDPAGTDEPTTTEMEADDGAAEAGVDLTVASSDLGDHLVDADGFTVYLFTEDPRGASVCTDDCLATWPAVTVDSEPVAGDGVDEALLDTITREDDGTSQLTYDGQPLYRFVSDDAPGDATGQGVGDVWYVVAPSGDAITDVAGGGDGDGGREY